jgi:arylsulfatase A-like enzyme
VVHNVSKVDYPAIPAPATEQGILASDTTTDKILNAAGYATHQYGKWHLSGDSLPYYPDPYGEHREYARELKPLFDDIAKRPREQWMNWYGWTLPVTVNGAYRDSFPPEDPIHKHGLKDFILKMGHLDLRSDAIFDTRVANKAIQRIRQSKDQAFSITCSFNWPHDPNVIHSPYYERVDPAKIVLPPTLDQREARFEKDLSRQMVAGNPGVRLREFLRVYHASVRFVDDQVGRVLTALDASGTAGNTIVVFTSDHGDMAGGHGMAWKSTQAFYDEIARVPLVVAWPGRIRPGKSDVAASLVDLAPTLLELTNQKVPSQMQGVSLASVLKGGTTARNRYVYRRTERVRPNAGRTREIDATTPADVMIRGGGWKYVRYVDGEEFLYDLKRDARETRNVVEERANQAIRKELARLATAG